LPGEDNDTRDYTGILAFSYKIKFMGQIHITFSAVRKTDVDYIPFYVLCFDYFSYHCLTPVGLSFSQDVPLESAPRLQEALVRANQATPRPASMPASGSPQKSRQFRHRSMLPIAWAIFNITAQSSCLAVRRYDAPFRLKRKIAMCSKKNPRWTPLAPLRGLLLFPILR